MFALQPRQRTDSGGAHTRRDEPSAPARSEPNALWQRLATRSPTVLPKLAIGTVDDPLEHEADRVADAVMRGAPVAASSGAPPSISRLQRCSCGGGGEKCAACRAEEEQELQRTASGDAAPEVAPPLVHDVLASPGEPLGGEARAFLEPRLGRGFGDVRVHTDARAAESARGVNAVAYTVGPHVVFGAGAYRPGSAEGRRLIAHELTHVVQQSNGTGREDGTGSSWLRRFGETPRDAVAGDESHPGILAQSQPPFPALQRQAQSEEKSAVSSDPSSQRALMLLDMFTKNRKSFEKAGVGEFDTERRDPAASEESIQGKDGKITWTLKFVTNSRTGMIYVRQSQNGPDIVNDWRLTRSNKCKMEALKIQFIESSDKYVNEADATVLLTPLADLLKANPELRITISGNIYQDAPNVTKGGSPAALMQSFKLNGTFTTAAQLMLARASRIQTTLNEKLKVTNVISVTNGSILDTDEGLKVSITVSNCKEQ